MKKRICILGSTGSIGTQALDVIAQHSDLYEAYVLTAYNHADLLIQQARQFNPEAVVIANESLQNGSSEAPSDFAQIETAVKPLVSVKAAQGFFDAGFAVDFSGSKITCSFPESYQFQGSDVSIVVYANAKSISIAGGSAVTLDLSRSSEVAINVTGAASLSTEKT